MSLYNMMHGVNPAAGILLGILGHTADQMGRLRDVYLDERDGERVIAVYTRNGGGNRECWDDDCGGNCTGCLMTDAIPNLEGYISDQDDDFDCTYATIWFRIPEGAKSTLADFELLIGGKTPAEKQLELIDKMQKGDKSDPDVKRAMDALSPVLEKIAEQFKDKP